MIEVVCRCSWAESARRCCRFAGVRLTGREGGRCGDETRCKEQIKYFIGSSKHWRYSYFAALSRSNEVHASNRSHPVIIAHSTRRLRNIDTRLNRGSFFKYPRRRNDCTTHPPTVHSLRVWKPTDSERGTTGLARAKISSCYEQLIHDPPIPNTFRVEFRIPQFRIALPSSIRQPLQSSSTSIPGDPSPWLSPVPFFPALSTDDSIDSVRSKTAFHLSGFSQVDAPTTRAWGCGEGSGRDLSTLRAVLPHR